MNINLELSNKEEDTIIQEEMSTEVTKDF